VPAYAFTEQGAMVLASPRALEMSVYVVRAFVRLREAALQHKDLAKRLDALEEDRVRGHAARHIQGQHPPPSAQVFEALRELTVPPEV
jgi:hypothetical protein